MSKNRIIAAAVLIPAALLAFGAASAIGSTDSKNVTGVKESTVQASVQPTCTTEDVNFDTQRVASASLESGKESVTTPGVNGKREVCLDSGKVQVSNKVTVQPVTQIITYGTYVAPKVEEPAYSGYSAICNDGTGSYSTGRGTCSHHGGIDHYTN